MRAFFRRHGLETSFQDEVLESLELSGLDQEHTLVLGGSAMALAGLRAAGDVDAMVPGEDFNTLARRRLSPSGLVVTPKLHTMERGVMRIHVPGNHLDIDTTRPDTLKTGEISPAQDERFLEALRGFPSVGGFHYLPLELVAEHKAQVGRHKDRKDIRLINDHLRR